MKTIKILLFFTMFICSTLAYSQAIDSTNTKYRRLFKNLRLGITIDKYPLHFKSLDFAKNNSQFSSYNSITGWNDNYLHVDGTYSYTNSSFLIENTYRGQKIDSYNPYGASSFNSALILGVVGGFLNKIQK